MVPEPSRQGEASPGGRDREAQDVGSQTAPHGPLRIPTWPAGRESVPRYAAPAPPASAERLN